MHSSQYGDGFRAFKKAATLLRNRHIQILTQNRQFDHFPLFAFAHLAFCAAAILARPSALISLRLGGLVVAAGRPRFGVLVWPFKSALAFSRRAISASIL